MTFSRIARLLILSICGTVAGSVSQSAYPEVRSYELDVSFDPPRAFMSARSHMEFVPRNAGGDTVVFFIHGELHVDSLWIGSDHVDVSQEPGFYYFDYSLVAQRCIVPLGGRTLREGMTVWYSGYFNPSHARTPSDYMRIDEDGVLLRAYGYSLWFPVFLESGQNSYQVSFPDVTIRAPADYVPVFTGERISESVAGDTRTSRWKVSDVKLFDVQCAARRFTVASEDHVFAYYEDTPASMSAAEKIMSFVKQLNDRCRRYYKADASGGQIHVVQMPQFGDISAGNVIGISGKVWDSFETSARSKRVLAHEFVHPFVHLSTPMSDPFWAFMIEAFPSYFHLPLLEELLGEEFYDNFMELVERDYLNKKRTGKSLRGKRVPPEKTFFEITADEVGEYKDTFILSDRALLFFNYLRVEMGKKAFFEFTKDLFSRDTMNEELFKAAIGEHLPDHDKDVHLWLYSKEYPDRFRLRAIQSEWRAGNNDPE